MLHAYEPVKRPKPYIEPASPNALRATRAVEGDEPEILGEIRSPGNAVAIWQRRLSAAFHAWMDGLAPEQLPGMRTVLRPQEVPEVVQTVFARNGVTRTSFRDWFIDDMAVLAHLYAQIMDLQKIQLRLDVVNDNACRRFHLDNVPARLLCTYRGRGTEFGCAAGGEDPDPIHELATGAVALFRGGRWPGREPCGMVHRSPPIEGSGETRLLLVIDGETDAG